MLNQNPEQKARDLIDLQLTACGWVIQHKSKINLTAAIGVAVQEYQTENGRKYKSKFATGRGVKAKYFEESI